MLDRQVLFEPLEEQFDLPPLLVDGGDSARRKIETVGKENQMQTGFRIAERNAAQPLRIALLVLRGRAEADGDFKSPEFKIMSNPLLILACGKMTHETIGQK